MVTSVADNDAALVARCKDGDDRQAFDDIVVRYKDRIVNYVRRMVSDRDDADDIAQEVFVRVYAGLRGFENRSALYTWLFRIATNLCIDYRRRRRRPERQHLSLDALPELAASGNSDKERGAVTTPEQAAIHSELSVMIERAIGTLPERLRAVVLLHDVEGLPYEDVARIVGCPLGTVKSRLFHARSALRDTLGPYLRGEAPQVYDKDRSAI